MTAGPPRQLLPAEQMRWAAPGPRASHLPSGQLPRPCSWAAAMPAALPEFFSPRAGGKAWRLPRGVTAPRGGLREPWLQTGALFCCFPRASLVLWPPGGAGAEEPGEGGSLEWHPLAPLGEGVLWDRAAWPGGLGPGRARRWVRIGSRVRCVAPAADAALAESTASTPAARGVGRRGVGGCVRGCAVGRSTGSGGTAPQKRRVSENISSGQIQATRPLTPRPAQRAACAHAHQTSRRSSGW